MNSRESFRNGTRRPRHYYSQWFNRQRARTPDDHYPTTVLPMPEVQRATQIVKMSIPTQSISEVEHNGIDELLDSLSVLIDYAPIQSVNGDNLKYIHRRLSKLYWRYLDARKRKWKARDRAKTAQNELNAELDRFKLITPMVERLENDLRGSVKAVFVSMIEDHCTLTGLNDEIETATIREVIELKQEVLSRFQYHKSQISLLTNMVSPFQSRNDYIAEKTAELAQQERRLQIAIKEQNEIDCLWRSCIAERPIQHL